MNYLNVVNLHLKKYIVQFDLQLPEMLEIHMNQNNNNHSYLLIDKSNDYDHLNLLHRNHFLI